MPTETGRSDWARGRLGRRRPRRCAPITSGQIDEGIDPAAVADLVADAIESDRFWVLPGPEYMELAVRRWERIAEGSNPETEVDIPGFPPATQIASEIRSALMEPSS